MPAGFNNNIIWNMAHTVSAQQGVCYARSGLELTVEDKYFTLYKPGTKPEEILSEGEIEIIKQLMMTTLDRLQTDYGNKIFINYTPVVTRYGVELSDIESAIDFLPFHEGLHLGYIMALKRLVTV
ncbi:MAG: DinB family protein [Mucilaginibacter sp.]